MARNAVTTSVAIWDLPTRLFHWLLAIAVLIAFFVEPEGALAFAAHAIAGYLALALVLFRLPWGIIGSRHSLFADFLYGPATVTSYAGRLLRLQLPRYVGHNPLGGWMVVILLVGAAATSLTGLFAGGEEGGSGPFAPATGEGLGDLHGTLANLLIALVVFHVAGVIIDILLTRENIVRAMITGRKELESPAASAEPPLVPSRRAVIPAIAAAAVLVYLLSATHFSGAGVGEQAAGKEED